MLQIYCLKKGDEPTSKEHKPGRGERRWVTTAVPTAERPARSSPVLPPAKNLHPVPANPTATAERGLKTSEDDRAPSDVVRAGRGGTGGEGAARPARSRLGLGAPGRRGDSRACLGLPAPLSPAPPAPLPLSLSLSIPASTPLSLSLSPPASPSLSLSPPASPSLSILLRTPGCCASPQRSQGRGFACGSAGLPAFVPGSAEDSGQPNALTGLALSLYPVCTPRAELSLSQPGQRGIPRASTENKPQSVKTKKEILTTQGRGALEQPPAPRSHLHVTQVSPRVSPAPRRAAVREVASSSSRKRQATEPPRRKAAPQ